jgi:creatinine amidohydrolase
MAETDDDLWTMTWEDAGEAFERGDAAVLPTGSTEQHSVHLPVSVDSIRAEHLTPNSRSARASTTSRWCGCRRYPTATPSTT